jgi:hypothetical protein
VNKLLKELEELKATRDFHRYHLTQNESYLPCGLRLNIALEYADMQFEEMSYPICKRIDEALCPKGLSLLPYDSNHVCDLCQEKKACYTLTRTVFGSHSRRCVNYVCNAATCGHNDFLTRRNTHLEEHNAVMTFFMQLNNAAAARDATQ